MTFIKISYCTFKIYQCLHHNPLFVIPVRGGEIKINIVVNGNS